MNIAVVDSGANLVGFLRSESRGFKDAYTLLDLFVWCKVVVIIWRKDVYIRD